MGSEMCIRDSLLDHSVWAEVQALNKLHLASLQQNQDAAEQQAHDSSLFVLDASVDVAGAGDGEWSGSDESSEQVLLPQV